jgi:hypothetical protein
MRRRTLLIATGIMGISKQALPTGDSQDAVRAVLRTVRATYVRALAVAVTKGNLYIEPVLRTADGAVALEGKWQLPYRPDYIDRSTGKSGLAQAPLPLSFKPLSTAYGACRVQVNPFSWDNALVVVLGISQERIKEVARRWFLEWLDPDDRNVVTKEGLFGVVHFIEESSDNNQTHFSVDLGSAAVEALEQLLIALAAAGASSVSVG